MIDLLDYIIDNQADRRREIYRNGQLVAMCHKSCEHPYLRAYGATEPFGTYPDAPREATCAAA